MAPAPNHNLNKSAASALDASKPLFKVESPNVIYTENEIQSTYVYRDAKVIRNNEGPLKVVPTETTYQFKVKTDIPKVGYVFLWIICFFESKK